jgi:NitT/TauT family transport system permease protein
MSSSAFSRLKALDGSLWVATIIGGALLLWEAVVRIFDVPAYLLPAPSVVVEEFLGNPGYYLSNGLFTLSTTVAGFVGATIVGVILAIAIVSSRVLDRILLTLLSAVHSIPKVALAPLLVIYLGTGIAQKIAIAVAIAIFTIVIDTVVGLRSVDPEVVNMARAKQASGTKIMLKIRLPHALPNLFGALKAATSFTLIGAIVGEFVAGEQGLGYIILTAQGAFDTPRAFVAVMMLAVMGTCFFYLLAYAERKVIPWHVSVRTGRRP